MTRKWVGSVVNSGEDDTKQGRWSFLTLEGKNGRKFTIITAYRVCKGNHKGTKTAYQQQWVLQREVGIENPDPREEILHDLKKFIQHRA